MNGVCIEDDAQFSKGNAVWHMNLKYTKTAHKLTDWIGEFVISQIKYKVTNEFSKISWL